MGNPRDLLEKLRQEPVSEDDLDRVMEGGGAEPDEPPRSREAPAARPSERPDPAAAREPSEDHRRIARRWDFGDEEDGAPARHADTGDESILEQRRAAGEFTSEGERTQVEEDFGERGLRMRGGPFDNRHQASILDPQNGED